jgi:rhodanese-related sulfurtransferase
MKLFSRENALLVDVRTRDEYNQSHIKGSICIPLDNLMNDIVKYEIDQNRKIIVYCASGRRSTVACQMLHEKGYKYVYNIYGGVKF